MINRAVLDACDKIDGLGDGDHRRPAQVQVRSGDDCM